jgi:hypothetical protein
MSQPEPATRDSSPIPLLRPARALTRTIRTRPPVQGTLALDWRLPGELGAVPDPGPGLRLVGREPALDLDTDPAVAVVATSRQDLPDPGPWTAQLVQAVLEVLAQERPRHQLVRWLTTEVYADLSTHLASAARRSAGGAPAPAGRARRTVSSIHVFEPADGVVEATAVVVGGRRARAVAVRLEGWDGRWRCTRLAIL